MQTQHDVTSTTRSSLSIAIVGGGITGCVAASELSKYFQNVILFDQGRRGPGGRASHRSVHASDGTISMKETVDEDVLTYEFDHGCQFFRADSEEMKRLVSIWLDHGLVSAWNGRFGVLASNFIAKTNKAPEADFFGIPSCSSPVYIGNGGMHQLPRGILQNCTENVLVQPGTRVSNIRKGKSNMWELYGISGTAAFHDTKDNEEEDLLACVDAVLFTDISSSFESWHRASAGIPNTLREQLSDHLSNKVRIPLFSCMVALETPIRTSIPYDAFTIPDDANSPLWFASCSQSKPNFFSTGNTSKASEKECWTLISTVEYAFQQIKLTPMRDAKTGEFLVQENDYLNTTPGPDLFNAFRDAIEEYWTKTANTDNERISIKPVYLQAQRWGSGIPVDETLAIDVEEVLGTKYATGLKQSLVYQDATSSSSVQDFVANDELRLYYAGDFCSNRNPGFEAAALSGKHAACHIIASFEEKESMNHK